MSNDQQSSHYTVVDLGANIGFHSLHMAACGAAVISFEASPDTAWLLRSSALLNGFLRDKPTTPYSLSLIPKGVSNTTTTGRLVRHTKSPGMTSFISPSESNNSFNLQKDTNGGPLDVDIPIVRAQDVLKELQVSPQTHRLRLLKIDVEGYEYQALQGLDLQQYPFEYITIEFFPTLIKGSGIDDPTDVLVYIWNHGYRFLDFQRKQIIDLPSLDEYPYVDTYGDDDVEALRKWAQNKVKNGLKRDGEGYHANLLAKLVKTRKRY
jgi:FkbM family methyltransferase